MVDETLHDRIEQYLLGQLPPSEAVRIEADMAADPALADQVALQRLTLMGMQRLAARDMRAHFDQWDADIEAPVETPSPPVGTARSPWAWATIALLLLLAAGAFWHFEQLQKLRAAQDAEHRQVTFRDSMIAVLQADYREKAQALEALLTAPGTSADSLTRLEIKRLREELERKNQALRELERRRSPGNPQIAMRLAPPPPRTRGGGANADAVMGAAKAAFDKANYAEAARLLQDIPAADPRQVQVVQMLPYALFYAGQYREAIPAFLNLWEQDADNETMNAQGYLLLCHIAVGNRLEARQMRLVILQNPKHKFYKEAEAAGEALR